MNKKAFQLDAYRPLAKRTWLGGHQISVQGEGSCTVRSKFDQIPSNGHQISLVERARAGGGGGSPCHMSGGVVGRAGAGRVPYLGKGWTQRWVSPCSISGGGWGSGTLYIEDHCIMGNGHMGSPVDRQTRLKTLPSHNFVVGQ